MPLFVVSWWCDVDRCVSRYCESDCVNNKHQLSKPEFVSYLFSLS